MGIINITQGVVVKTKQTEWYDHTYWIYPFTGEYDYVRMHDALHTKFWRPCAGKFGGGSSIGTIEQVAPGWVEVEHIYHIGD